MERAYRNVGYLLLALPLIAIAGFWIPYFSQIPHFDKSITPAVHIHALLLFTWITLLVIQPLAIRQRAYLPHRVLGRISYFLMPLIVVFAIAMVRKEYLEHRADGVSRVAGLREEYLSVFGLLALASLYLLAIRSARRRDIAYHMRYMICTALAVLPAALARVLGYWFDVRQWHSQIACFLAINLTLIALILFDVRRSATPAPYLQMLAFYAVFEVGWAALGFPV
jgi:hypothetical protein